MSQANVENQKEPAHEASEELRKLAEVGAPRKYSLEEKEIFDQGFNEGQKLERSEQRQIHLGTFFSPISEVWEGLKTDLTENEARKRVAFSKIKRRDGYYNCQIDYKCSVNFANDSTIRLHPNYKFFESNRKGRSTRRPPSIDASTESSTSGGQETAGSNSSTDTNIYCIQGRRSSSTAHIIPESLVCQCVHGVVAQAALGYFPEKQPHFGSKEDQIRVIHQLVCGRQGDDDMFSLPGIATSPLNFLRMPSQHGLMFDDNPCWMIVPIFPDLESIKEWKRGTGYWVMAIAGGHGEYSDEQAHSAFLDVSFNDDEELGPKELKREKCTANDIQNATEHLKEMVLAMAEVLVGHEEDGEISPLHLFPDRNKADTKKSKSGSKKGKSENPPPPQASTVSMSSSFTSASSGASHVPKNSKMNELLDVKEDIKKRGVFLPGLRKDSYKDARVMKIFLEKKKDTYVPDPFLLLVKAAISWSARFNQALLPVGEHDDKVPRTIQFRTVTPPVTVAPDDDVLSVEAERVKTDNNHKFI